MDTLLQVVAIAILVMSAVQMFFVLTRNWRQMSVSEKRHSVQLELLEEKLSQASMRRQAEQLTLNTNWPGLRKFKIDRKVDEGGGICSFYLTPHDGKALPSFYPGQYLTFNIKTPDQVRPLIRCYSLSDSPYQADFYRVSIKHALPPRGSPHFESGVVSSFFHQRLNEGDIVDVKAPAGNFYLDTKKHTPIVLIGGGIGITPVLSMLNTLVELNSKREIWFFYGVRNGGEQIQASHLQAIDAEYENVHLHACFSNPQSDDQKGINYQHAERVSVNLLKRLLPSNNYEYYLCGPSSMMSSLTQDLNDWGVPEDKIHFEAFGPASVKVLQPDEASGVVESNFSVTFSRSGKTTNWTQRSGSLLELAESCGINIDFGCRAGSCGTCLTALKSGEVDYIDDSSEPEKGSCLACLAKPKSDLVLDA